MSPEAFNNVDWDVLKLILSRKSKMYSIWYRKQCSGWYGTGQKNKQWKQTDNVRYPNCNSIADKDADHLMVCCSEGRTCLLMEQVQRINEWMETHHTHPLQRGWWLTIFADGALRKIEHLRDMLPEVQALAQTQDRIE